MADDFQDPEVLNVRFRRGDTYRRVLSFESAPGVPLNLDGFSFAASARVGYGYPVVFTIPLSLGDEPGTLEMLMTDEDSALLPHGLFLWSLQLTDAGGDTSTPFAGVLEVYR